MTDTEPEGIDERTVPTVPLWIASVVLDGEAVLLDVDTGALHILNPIATVIWSCFDGSQTLGDIVGHLAELFHVEPETVRRDVLALAADLCRKGLLDGFPIAGCADTST